MHVRSSYVHYGPWLHLLHHNSFPLTLFHNDFLNTTCWQDEGFQGVDGWMVYSSNDATPGLSEEVPHQSNKCMEGVFFLWCHSRLIRGGVTSIRQKVQVYGRSRYVCCERWRYSLHQKPFPLRLFFLCTFCTWFADKMRVSRVWMDGWDTLVVMLLLACQRVPNQSNTCMEGVAMCIMTLGCTLIA